MFKIGERVVCVDAYFQSGPWDVGRPNLPAQGHVYTIRNLLIWDWPDTGPGFAVLLDEVVNPVTSWRGDRVAEIPFTVLRFRPLTEKQTDITVFTEILNRENKNSRVPVSLTVT